MGLDMYLSARKFMKWDKEEKQRKKIEKILKLPKGKELTYVEIEVMYWRKANAIHSWFVENIQEEVDNCQSYEVSKVDLKRLLQLCEMVIADPKSASDILPVRQGFFFGSYEYDEWYFNDIKRTAKELKELLENKELEDYSFTYQSSW